MIETFIALIFAHIVADYVLLPLWMVQRKKDPGILLAHGAVVLMVTMAALGRVDAPEILALGAAHLIIDGIKTYALPDNLRWHLTDQAAHFVTIAAVATYAPNLWQSGLWANELSVISHVMLLLGGLILTTRAGAFAIEKLMAIHPVPDKDGGLPSGGKTIGYLERGLIYVLVLAGQSAAIGFLIAAKSILRFGAVSKNRHASEYVIIGTLASFGWAIVTAIIVAKLFHLLPPLEIAPLNP
jgi:hypothetical protein